MFRGYGRRLPGCAVYLSICHLEVVSEVWHTLKIRQIRDTSPLRKTPIPKTHSVTDIAQPQVSPTSSVTNFTFHAVEPTAVPSQPHLVPSHPALGPPSVPALRTSPLPVAVHLHLPVAAVRGGVPGEALQHRQHIPVAEYVRGGSI